MSALSLPRSISTVNISRIAKSADRVGSVIRPLASISPPKLSNRLSRSFFTPQSPSETRSSSATPITPSDELLGSDNVLEWLQCGESQKQSQTFERKIDPNLGTYSVVVSNNNDMFKLKITITALNSRDNVVFHTVKRVERQDKTSIPIDIYESEPVRLRFKVKLDTLSSVKRGDFSIELFHSEIFGNSIITF
jgi:ribosomal protein L28